MATKKTTGRKLVVRPRRRFERPDFAQLYPWAHNLLKIEKAHNEVLAEQDDRAHRGKEPMNETDFQQAVMDKYVENMGLVRGHESITIVGRRGIMKKNFAPGKSTSQVLGKDPTQSEDDDDNSAVEEEVELPPINPEDLPGENDDDE